MALGPKRCRAVSAQAPQPAALLHHPGRDLPLDVRQRKPVGGLVGRRQAQRRVATAPALGGKRGPGRWRPQPRTRPDPPRVAARLAGCGSRRAPGRLRGRMVRRRRPVGRGRVWLATSLQTVDTVVAVSEVGQIVLHCAQIGVDRGWGLLPGLGRTGQGPGGAGRGSGLLQRVTTLRQGGTIRALFLADPGTGVERKRRALPTETLPVRGAAAEGSLGASAERCTGCAPVIAYPHSLLRNNSNMQNFHFVLITHL